MRKKTTMGLVIATILTSYISALTLSNQAFAQVHTVMPGTGGLPGFGNASQCQGIGGRGRNREDISRARGRTREGRTLTWRCMPKLLGAGISRTTRQASLGCSPLHPRGC